MKVRCISNSARDLSPSCLSPEEGYSRDTIFSIAKGEEYTVYAITTYLGHLWYHIWDRDSVTYPCWNPSPLFEISDGRLSRCWVVGSHKRGGDHVCLFGYPEWVHDPSHVSMLVDGDDGAEKIFQKYKQQMDTE